MRASYDKTIRILLPIIAGAGCMVALLSAANAIVELRQATPRVGDIVSFTASAAQPIKDGTRLIVHRPDHQFGCILDLSILQKSGGSLVVESLIDAESRSFRVHWAGEQTTADASNCGGDADLIVGAGDLDILALATGGYGANRKRTPIITAGTGN